MSAPRLPYSFALLRVVPHPYTGAFANVGVVLHSRPAEFVGLRALTDEDRLRALAPDADIRASGPLPPVVRGHRRRRRIGR